jgi:hypothetical protein
MKCLKHYYVSIECNEREGGDRGEMHFFKFGYL